MIIKNQSKRSAYHFDVQLKTERRSGENASENKLVIRGYPILFNAETKIYDFWHGECTEVILPTALDGTKMDRVYLLVGHNPDNVLGLSGVNMRLEVDETGLFFECELPNTQLARDWYNLIESGIVDGMSFGFICHDEVNSVTKTRTITHIEELFEITITPFPAYFEASVIAKTERQAKEEKDERDKFIKEMEEW